MKPFELKCFQRAALSKLRSFLDETRLLNNPHQAFLEVSGSSGYRPVPELPQVPSVCLRLPTGGGKTILGAYAVGVAAEGYLEREFPVVLWLVPSNPIREQTRRAFDNVDHPYRVALGKAFNNNVRIFDIGEFENLTPQDIAQNCCVVIGTMQTLRATNTEDRRVYAHNESMEGHFTAASRSVAGLELIEAGAPGAGTPKYSFANVLKIQRPIVIVDEAQHFVTGLSEVVRQRIGPSVVIELTATPDPLSNVLYRASAAELKAAEMVKLPVVLTEHTAQWQDAVCQAVATRKKLAALAQTEPEYVRPLLLLQAENVGKPSDWKAIKQYLMETEGISEREIAVETGTVRELKDVDLFSDKCPITCIITVQALKEGWDCSFAYVLCSTANIGNAQDVEQLLGRVLRMPFAKSRRNQELNKAYAHVASERFGETARKLQDALVEMGFEIDEAKQAIETPQGDLPLEEFRSFFDERLAAKPDLTGLSEAERTQVQILEEDGVFRLRARNVLSDKLVEAVLNVAPVEARTDIRRRAEEHNRDWERSPSEQGTLFAVPRLVVRVGDNLELFDKETLSESWDFDLLRYPADLHSFSYDEVSRRYSLDLEGRKVVVSPMDDAEQLVLLHTEMTRIGLVTWLDKRLRSLEVAQSVLSAWLLKAIDDALGRGITLETLDRGKFLLLRKLGELMQMAKIAEAARGFQSMLLDVQVDTSEEFRFSFPRSYTPGWLCPNTYRFKKHYYPRPGELKGTGEEFECAVEIDRLSEVNHWVRNLAPPGSGRERTSFWLQTPTSRFYPDFVAELKDGRTLIVEYKGRMDELDERKLEMGNQWAARSGGKAIFLMAFERDANGRSVRDQLLSAIALPIN